MVIPLLVAGTIAATAAASAGAASSRIGKRRPGFASVADDQYTELLRQRALGNGPSAAELQGQQAQEDARAMAMSLAASGQGTNIAAARLNAQNSAASTTAQIAAGTQQAKLQEQAQAQAAYQSEMQREQDARLAYESLRAQDSWNRASNKRENTRMIVGAIGGGMGALSQGLSSDMRAKEDVRPAHIGLGRVRETMDELEPYEYRYKPDDAARLAENYSELREPRAGVMAQDLERTPLGSTMVSEDEDGRKAIDRDKGLSLSLAGIADLNERLARLEKRRGAR